MKSELSKKEVVELDFPRLMVSTDNKLVILFTDTHKGTPVGAFGEPKLSIHELGYRSLHWDMTEFKEYDGIVSLQND
tara:strand:+ start:2913 stop:3143 length:231 start_codon:yes stop_codon:yes gene_type:complete